MEQEKDIILTKLNKMLETKTFSDPVKEKINCVISKAYDSYSNGDKKSFFEQLISELSSVDEFRINTRKQLNKRENISPLLSKCTLGFTTIDHSLVVVTKEANEERTIYHEMVHLTQNKNSYYINKKYPFSEMITICLLEGEASYYDIDLKKKDEKSKVEVLKYPEMEFGFGSKQNYPFYSMVYELLLDIFGKDIMKKWKNIGPKDDIMPILEESFEKKSSEFSFHVFYLFLTKLIIEYFNHLEKGELNFKNYISAEIKKFEFEKIALENKVGEWKQISKNIDDICKKRKQNNDTLQDETLLKVSYKKRVEELKQELKKYEESPEYDREIANDWKHDLEEATIEDYRDYLFEQEEEYKKKIQILKQEEKRLLEIQTTEIKTNFFIKLKVEPYIDQKYNFLDYLSFLMTLIQNKELGDYKIVDINKEKHQTKN